MSTPPHLNWAWPLRDGSATEAGAQFLGALCCPKGIGESTTLLPLLQRTLLYTAITRAKRLCVIVGTRRALLHAVGNVRALQCYTGLVPAIRQAWSALEQRALPSQ